MSWVRKCCHTSAKRYSEFDAENLFWEDKLTVIETVRGAINPERLGITLAHEHIIIDVTVYHRSLMPEEAEASQARLRDQPVSEETLTLLDRNPLIQLDNLRLNDVQLAAEELSLFKKLGGGSVIDVTPRGLGRDVNSVRKISDLTELNIVVATGWYISSSHPAEVVQGSKDELAQVMVRELTEGIEDTGVRAGVIKCAVGGITGDPTDPIEKRKIHPDEEKVLRAAS